MKKPRYIYENHLSDDYKEHNDPLRVPDCHLVASRRSLFQHQTNDMIIFEPSADKPSCLDDCDLCFTAQIGGRSVKAIHITATSSSAKRLYDHQAIHQCLGSPRSIAARKMIEIAVLSTKLSGTFERAVVLSSVTTRFENVVRPFPCAESSKSKSCVW